MICRPLSVEVELLNSSLYPAFRVSIECVRRSCSEVEVSPTGLGVILRAESELALEVAAYLIGQQVPEIRVGSPTVEYLRGSELFEPIARVRVCTHVTDLERVSEDALSRRGSAITIEEDLISFDAPYSELWGYSTALRSLTQGRGALNSVRFLEYRPAPRVGNNDDPVHA